MTPHEAMREAAEKASYYTAVGGGTATGVLGWVNDNWLGLAGVLIALAGLCVNWYYSHQRHKILKEQNQQNV